MPDRFALYVKKACPPEYSSGRVVRLHKNYCSWRESSSGGGTHHAMVVSGRPVERGRSGCFNAVSGGQPRLTIPAANPGWQPRQSGRRSCQRVAPADGQAKKAVRWTARQPGDSDRQATADNSGKQPRQSGRSDAGCDVMPFCQLFSFLQSFAG